MLLKGALSDNYSVRSGQSLIGGQDHPNTRRTSVLGDFSSMTTSPQ